MALDLPIFDLARQHDEDVHTLFPNERPEVCESLVEWALGGNVLEGRATRLDVGGR